MNTYVKYCPNVYVAKCEEQHQKGDVIVVTTKYGKENEHYVHNLVGQRDGFYFYSITRVDGYNCQERAKAKAEKYEDWADSARQRSDEAFQRSENAVAGIPLGQPILVDHYSARRHRRALDKSWAAMDKCVAESRKAEDHDSKAKYWERKSQDINLSMPESLEYYADLLEKAKAYHQGMKEGKIERTHSYSLTYAKKAVNEMHKNYDTAVKLWGDKTI